MRRDDDGVYEIEMAALNKRVAEREMAKEKKVKVDFETGDLVLCAGQVYRAGEIDPMGKWVMLGIHKHGTDMVKKYPAVYLEEYINACAAVGQEPI
jgi:hypothetical protein